MKEFIDKLIAKIEEAKVSANRRNAFDSEVSYACAIDIVNKLAEEYGKDTNVTTNGWIPCSERLPEKYGTYLCCDRYGEYILGYPTARVSSDDYYVETEYEIMNDCIAWMPLPAPFKEGE